MPHNLPPMETSLTHRRLLQGPLGGAAGLVAWHQGWPRLQSAAAQKHTPSGQMTWAIHVTLAPSWLDPSETLALATPSINEAENLGYATLTGGMIPRKFAYTLPLEPYGYDPKKARQLLKEARQMHRASAAYSTTWY